MAEPRPDHDAPRRGDAYVLRLEDAEGYRLAVRTHDLEVAQASDLNRLLLIKAQTLIAAFLDARERSRA